MSKETITQFHQEHAPQCVGVQIPITASYLLGKAADHMGQRAKTYDKPQGERSMSATVKAFNAITGRNLSASEGWLLMALLKMVRDNQRAAPHADSIEDLVAYAALYGESRLGGNDG